MTIIFSTKCNTLEEKIISTQNCIKTYEAYIPTIWDIYEENFYTKKLDAQKLELQKLLSEI